MKVRVIIADDHPVVVHGIKEILERNEQFEVIASFVDGRSLLQSPLLASADVLLLDLNMPCMDGLEVLNHLMKLDLAVRIIVITSYLSPKLSEQCLEKGAMGYLVKSDDLYLLEGSIKKVVCGEKVFPEFFSPQMEPENDYYYFDEFLKKYKLTKREVEIIRLVCNDFSSKQIADKLFLSNFTVQTHRRNIVRKLGLEGSKIALYKFAMDNKVI